ncbi:MAG: EI24 domain-containing protein, partial [Proteobacteria bacterium]|nr:EI24 domain-containing protein [Pseudomonadota bacterium]
TRDNSTCGSCTASFMPALIAASKRKSQYCLSSTSHQGLGTMNDGALALAWLVLLILLSLPLWFVPPLWPVLPILLFGYLNQRVFRYDALAEHAAGWEMDTLFRRHRGEMLLLGVVLALFGLIPVLGFFAPVYGGLAFIHYCLARLAQLRDEPVAIQ